MKVLVRADSSNSETSNFSTSRNASISIVINTFDIDSINKIFEIISSLHAAYQTTKIWNFSKAYVMVKNVDEVNIYENVRASKWGCMNIKMRVYEQPLRVYGYPFPFFILYFLRVRIRAHPSGYPRTSLRIQVYPETPYMQAWFWLVETLYLD